MKKATEIYKECLEDDYWYGTGDYQPMLEQFGEIVVQVDDNDYQGDSRVLYKDKKRYGWLQFGWGSCSGCDALQACSSIDEIQELMDELKQQIKWFESAHECHEYFSEKDWSIDYSWMADQQREFINKVKKQTKRRIK
jgi:hypothetical protein